NPITLTGGPLTGGTVQATLIIDGVGLLGTGAAATGTTVNEGKGNDVQRLSFSGTINPGSNVRVNYNGTRNERQVLTFSNTPANGSTFTLGYGTGLTTPNTTFSTNLATTATNIETALNTLFGVANSFSVVPTTSGANPVFNVSFIGQLGATNFNVLTA